MLGQCTAITPKHISCHLSRGFQVWRTVHKSAMLKQSKRNLPKPENFIFSGNEKMAAWVREVEGDFSYLWIITIQSSRDGLKWEELVIEVITPRVIFWRPIGVDLEWCLTFVDWLRKIGSTCNMLSFHHSLWELKEVKLYLLLYLGVEGDTWI